MKRKESERTQNYRRRSYMHAKQREDAEQWRPLGVHAMNSSASQQKFQELYIE